MSKLKFSLPEYTPESVTFWFKRVDKAFEAAEVKKPIEKICHLMDKLPASIALTYEAHIDANDYDGLKAAILGAKGKTDEERFRIFQNCTLGDRKPSELMAELFQQLPRDDSAAVNFILKQTFMSKLPADLAQLMDGYAFDVTGHNLALAQDFLNKADSLFAKAPKNRTIAVSEVTDDSSGGAAATTTSEEAEIASIVRNMPERMRQDYYRGRFQGGKPNRGGRGRGRGGGNRSGYSSNGGQTQSEDVKVCHNHKKFGDSAWKCLDPAKCFLKDKTKPKN